MKLRTHHQKISSFIVIALLCCITFSCFACSSRKQTDQLENHSQIYIIAGSSGTFYQNGLYFIGENQEIRYFDYEQKESIVACNKKNCSHEPWTSKTPEEERCNAYSEVQVHAILPYRDKLYTIVKDMQYMSESPVVLWESDLAGNNQKKVATLNLFFPSGSAFFLEDNFYYTATENSLEQPSEEQMLEEGFVSNTKVDIRCINLETGEETILTETYEGMGSGINLVGIYDNYLYYKLTTIDPKERLNNTESNVAYNNLSGIKTQWHKLSLSSGESAEILPDLDSTIAGQDFIIEDDLYTCLVDLSGYQHEDDDYFNYYGRYYPAEIRKINLQTGDYETIVKIKLPSDASEYAMGEWLFYQELDQTDTITFYNVQTEKFHKISKEQFYKFGPIKIQTIADSNKDEQLLLVTDNSPWIDDSESDQVNKSSIWTIGYLQDYLNGTFKGTPIE